MGIRRREFIGTAAALASSAEFRAWGAPHGADLDFAGVAAKLGWSADDPGAFCFLHATDLHMTENPDWDLGALQLKDKFMGRCFVDDMNALKDRAAFAVLTGDLTSHTTMNPSSWPWAEKKWRHFRKHVADRLKLPFWQFIGNNDCAAAPYLRVFPDRQTHWSFEKGGILFAGLHGYDLWKPENTNHAGIKYGDAQLAWLAKLVRESNARTLVLFTHEGLCDSDSHCARRQLAPIVESFRGEAVWNVYGHGHENCDCTFLIGRREVRGLETMTPVGEGFTLGDGGYRVVFCKGGRVHATAFRWLTQSGEPIGFAEDPQWGEIGRRRSRMLEQSFPADALEVRLVGEHPFELGELDGVEDRIADYYIRRPWTDRKTGERRFGILRFAVPNAAGGRKARRIVLRGGRLEGHLGFSSDGKAFDLRPVSLGGRGDTDTFELPESAAEKTWVYLSNESKYEHKFFGYALLGDGGDSTHQGKEQGK